MSGTTCPTLRDVHDELAQVAQHTAARGRQLAGVVADLARPVLVVGSSMPVGELEVMFRSPELACVAVQEEEGQNRFGLITRAHFTGALTGRLGYGRAVLERRPVTVVTDWSPLVVDAQASVADVATRSMERVGEHRYDDVLVHGMRWASASTADLMRALVGALAQRSTHDPLTLLQIRSTTWHSLTRRCALVGNGRTRVAIVLLDVRGMADLNARYGQAVGDSVLAELAARLTAALPQGCEAGRVDGNRFAVLATIPPADDIQAAATADWLRRHLVENLAQPSGDVPPSAWPTLHSSVVWSVAGAADADEMVREAEARLKQAPARL